MDHVPYLSLLLYIKLLVQQQMVLDGHDISPSFNSSVSPGPDQGSLLYPPVTVLPPAASLLSVSLAHPQPGESGRR